MYGNQCEFCEQEHNSEAANREPLRDTEWGPMHPSCEAEWREGVGKDYDHNLDDFKADREEHRHSLRDGRDDYYDSPDPAMDSGDPYDRHADAMDRYRTYSRVAALDPENGEHGTCAHCDQPIHEGMGGNWVDDDRWSGANEPYRHIHEPERGWHDMSDEIEKVFSGTANEDYDALAGNPTGPTKYSSRRQGPPPFPGRTATFGEPDQQSGEYPEEHLFETDEPDRDDSFVHTHGYGGYDATHGGTYLGKFPNRAAAEHAVFSEEKKSGFYPNLWHVDERGGTELDDGFERQHWEKDPHKWRMENDEDYAREHHERTERDLGDEVDDAMESSEHLRGLLDDGKVGPTKYSRKTAMDMWWGGSDSAPEGMPHLPNQPDRSCMECGSPFHHTGQHPYSEAENDHFANVGDGLYCNTCVHEGHPKWGKVGHETEPISFKELRMKLPHGATCDNCGEEITPERPHTEDECEYGDECSALHPEYGEGHIDRNDPRVGKWGDAADKMDVLNEKDAFEHRMQDYDNARKQIEPLGNPRELDLLKDNHIGPTKWSSKTAGPGPCNCGQPGHSGDEHSEWAQARHAEGTHDAWGRPLMQPFDGHGAWNCNNYDCTEHPQSMYEQQPGKMPGWLEHDTAGPEERDLRKQVNDATSGSEWLLDQQHQGPTKYSARDQATCPHSEGWNLHGQCKACGYIPPTESDEECDHPYCQETGFAEGWHTKGEHIDPPHLDPNSDEYRDAEKGVEEAFRQPGLSNAEWLLHQQTTGPTKYSSIDPFTLVREAASDPEFRFHITASWNDVRNKAKRLRSEGKVRIVAASGSGVQAEVQGDHHIYETGLQYAPGSTRKVAIWQCGCKWASYAWGRSPRYKRFEGRMCSHALALQFEAQARTMFGKEISEDRDRLPGQHQRTPVVVEFDKDRDRNVTRRTVPPGNMRSVWSSVTQAVPVVTAVVQMTETDRSDEIGLLLHASKIPGADVLAGLAKTAAAPKHPCEGCGHDTTASGLCSHCKRAQVIPLDHDSMDPELADKHVDMLDVLRRRAQEGQWSRPRVSANAKMINLRFSLEQAKRDRDNPKPGYYAHPELNELAEMTHEMRKTDPRWLPSQFQHDAAVNNAWGDPAPPVDVWQQRLPGATSQPDPLSNPASTGFASGPDPIGWHTISPMTMGDRVASMMGESEDGDTDVCANCGGTIKRTTIDPNVPWIHHGTGNAYCDVSSPADAVMLRGVEGDEAEPLVHESSMDTGEVSWDSHLADNATGATATLHDEPEPALPSTDGAGPEDILGDQSDQMHAVYDDALSPDAMSMQSIGAVDDIVAQFQRNASHLSPSGGGGPRGSDDGMDIAAAAREHLAKEAVKTFTPAEQDALIHEEGSASNLDRLDVTGTHYAVLDDMRYDEDDPDGGLW